MNDEARTKLMRECTAALTGEEPIVEGPDENWLFIGGVTLNRPFFIRDAADSGAPMVKVTVELCPGMPDMLRSKSYRALILRDDEGGLLRLAIDFSNPLEYSNQPVDLSSLLRKG